MQTHEKEKNAKRLDNPSAPASEDWTHSRTHSFTRSITQLQVTESILKAQLLADPKDDLSLWIESMADGKEKDDGCIRIDGRGLYCSSSEDLENGQAWNAGMIRRVRNRVRDKVRYRVNS